MALVFCVRQVDPRVGFFAEETNLRWVRRIEYALTRAKTWGSLRKLLPPVEFEDLELWACNGGEHVYFDRGEYQLWNPTAAFDPDDYTEEELDEYVVKARQSFDPNFLPGFEEGEYPPCLEIEQEALLPEDFDCYRFGGLVDSFTSGSWWEFPVDRYDEMKAVLEGLERAVVKESEMKRQYTSRNPKTWIYPYPKNYGGRVQAYRNLLASRGLSRELGQTERERLMSASPTDLHMGMSLIARDIADDLDEAIRLFYEML